MGGGFGYQVSPAWRADLSFSYRPGAGFSKTDSGLQLNLQSKLSSWRGFLTGYLDVAGLVQDNTVGLLNPYLGFGVGAARNHLKTFSVTDLTAPAGANQFGLSSGSETSFAWQVVAGVGYELSKAVVLDASFRYVDAGDARSGTSLTAAGVPSIPFNAIKGGITSEELVVGLRFRF